MLIVISDLHLTDGSNGVGVDPGALELFQARLTELALRASWRSDGCYRPLERIDVLLLGDVIDFTRSRRWLAGQTRPWSDLLSPALFENAAQILEATLATNEQAVRVLRGIGSEGAIRLPQVATNGLPLMEYEPQPIPVSIHYLVGNTDWLLHVRAGRFEQLRKRVCHAMGLANDHREPFPHDAAESEELLETLRSHGVVARHGDVFDPLHCGEDRDASSVGEAIAIDLVQQFLLEIEERYGHELHPVVLNALRELDHFRPLALAALFLEGTLERSHLRPILVKEIKRTWDRLAEQLLQQSHVRAGGGLTTIHMIDDLAASLLFSHKISLGWAGAIRNWMCSLRGATSSSYYQHALAEADCRNRRARHIVYGHTHRAETVPLDASYADGVVLQQTYFNAGAWRRVYEQTHSVAGEHEFIAADTFSFLTFFQGDERGGRPYETWTGSLGTVAETFQPANTQTEATRTTKTPIRAPHFQSAPNAIFSQR
jgi:UDP-2,3-diacylglucosamine pyrophosphatase LpxH